MIIFLHGTDTKKIQDKSQKIVDVLRTKKPNASFVRMNNENFDKEIDTVLSGSGLFESNYIVSIKNVSSDKELWKTVSKKLKDIQKSSHVFVWVEDGKETAAIKKIKLSVEKAEEHNSKEIKKEDEPIFAFLDLFFTKNNKDAWLWFVKNPVDISQVLNLIMWQAKSIKLASISNSAVEAGLKPFVYSKSKRLASAWSDEKISELYVKCLDWQTRGRQGDNISAEFEKYLLCV